MCSGRVGKSEMIFVKYHTDRTVPYSNKKFEELYFNNSMIS
jgi:hypothetical protein